MKSFSSIALGLSVVFGFLLLACVAELYYLLWWKKKRVTNREIEVVDNGLICWKKPPTTTAAAAVAAANYQEHSGYGGHEPDMELGSNVDLMLKPVGEEGVETELMRLYNLQGPPRFLSTIKEETKEDLESVGGKSSRKGSRTRSLSDFVVNFETPFLSPVSSPHLKSNSLNHPLDCYSHHGFNPLFESAVEAELNRLRSSPPPKFKFLRDAEEKLYRKLLEEAEKMASKNGVRVQDSGVNTAPVNASMNNKEEKEGSFVKLIVGKNKERETHHSSSSQVLPLASSPTSTFRPPD